MCRVFAALLLCAAALFAAPKQPPIPFAARASTHFDARAATDGWLATVPAAARAKSDTYFEGGYWLLLWDFLYTVTIALMLLETRLSARMRSMAERLTRFIWLQSFLCWIELAMLTAILFFPLTCYEDFFREHKYGLSNQSFSSWFRDQFVGFIVLLTLGGAAFIVLVGVVRRFRRTWHIWGAAVMLIVLIVSIMIGPVFIAPLFNTYTPLQDVRIKKGILSLARANGIPATNVYQVNASRQSKRVSANVSGLLGTERITLNDNLLNRCSPQAIMATMGHEMGHYVMHHLDNTILFFCIVFALVFAVLRWALERAVGLCGERGQLRGADDPAALPLAVAIVSILTFLFTPFANTFTRTQEYEADLYGLNAARQPDGETEVDLLLGEYRKLDPSPLEEFIFFDHPSGRTRIYAAMRWKQQNLCLFDSSLPCASPASFTRSDLKSSESIAVKTATFAPIPKASDSVTMMLNPGSAYLH